MANPNIMASMLMPVENFQQKRQDRLNEAKFTDQITQNMLFREQSMQQERAIAEAELARLRSLDLEPEDKFRVESLLDQMQEGMKKKIKSKYTNVSDYLRTEFAQDLEMMKSALLSSNEFKNGVHNKQVLTQYREDLKKGLQARGDIDLSGAITKTKDGREVIDYSKVKIRSFEDQLSQYRTGSLDRLDYKGGYNIPTKFAGELTKQFGADRFKKEEISNDAKIAAMGTYDGLDPRDALYEVKRRGLDVSPMFYKYEDQYKKNEYELEMANKVSAINNRARQTSEMQRQNRLYEQDMKMRMGANVSEIDMFAMDAMTTGIVRSQIKDGNTTSSGLVKIENGVTGVLKEAKSKLPIKTIEAALKSSGATPELDSKGKPTGNWVMNGEFDVRASNMRKAVTKSGKVVVNPKDLAVFVPTKADGKITRDGANQYRLYLKTDIPINKSTANALGASTNILSDPGKKGFVRGSLTTHVVKSVDNSVFNPFGDNDQYLLRDGYIELNRGFVGQTQETKDANIKVQDTSPFNPFNIMGGD